jgi:P27 family predicted phage terminase small subunit
MPPEDISEGGLAVWNRLAPDLIDKGCLTHWDVHTFTVFCEAVHVYHDCRKRMGDKYTDRGGAGGVIKSPYWQIMRDCAEIMAKYSSRFGLTPSDRAALKVSEGESSGPGRGPERIFE